MTLKHSISRFFYHLKSRLLTTHSGLVKTSSFIQFPDLIMNGKVGLIVLLVLTIIHGAENTEVIGSLEPIEAVIGDGVILPCHLEPLSDVTDLVVEWKLNKSFVHVYRHREDSPDLQDKRFENRTSLFREEMTKGNISLKLSSVQRSDEGRYTCFVPQLRGKRGVVDLTVALKVTEGNKMQERGESKEPDGEKMYAGKIAGIVVAVVVTVVVLLVGGVVWAVKRRQSTQQAARSGVAVDLHEMDKLTSQTTETPAA